MSKAVCVGSIFIENFKKLLITVEHMNLSSEDLDDMFECIDVDATGTISFKDFVASFADVT